MAEALLSVLMRWLHISSVATLIGGALYGWAVASAAAQKLGPESCDGLREDMAARFRPLVYTAVAGLVVSGLYNVIAHPGHSVTYQTLLGIKLLLVLHVFAVMLLSAQPNRQRRARMMAGAAISGLVIIAISAYLRRIF
jgi:putative copper export protein